MTPFPTEDEGPFVVRAFITKDDTLPPGRSFGKNTVSFTHIYQHSPSLARYVVLTYEKKVKVADLYESQVVPDPSRVIPRWVNQTFKNVDHAIAAMRIGYDHNNGQMGLLSGRQRLEEYKSKDFDQAFNKFSKE